MTIVKLTPSAIVDVELMDLNGNVIESQQTRNSLLSSFTYGIGRGVFSHLFTIRFGSSASPSNYYDTFLYQPLSLTNPNTMYWPIATDDTVWPMSTITSDSKIKWTTTQVFVTIPGQIVGTVNEIGLNFYGDQSSEIHARAVLNTPINLSAEHVLRIRYTLNIYAVNEDLSYTVNSIRDETVVQHTVTQRWANPCTLKDLIVGPIPDADCLVYGGDMNGYNVEPQDLLGTSVQAYMDSPDNMTCSLVAVIDADSGNNLTGIKTVKFTTFPVKLSFDPPIAKTNSSTMTLRLDWVLGN